MDIYWWHSRSLGYIGIYWSRNAFEGVKIMPSSQPENQLDNDKDLRQEILYEFLNQFKEDKYLSQGNTDKAVGAIDQYTQSKLKAFAGEIEEAIGKDDRDYSQDNTDLASKIALVASSAACNELRVELRQALKAIKERWNLNG